MATPLPASPPPMRATPLPTHVMTTPRAKVLRPLPSRTGLPLHLQPLDRAKIGRAGLPRHLKVQEVSGAIPAPCHTPLEVDTPPFFPAESSRAPSSRRNTPPPVTHHTPRPAPSHSDHQGSHRSPPLLTQAGGTELAAPPSLGDLLVEDELGAHPPSSGPQQVQCRITYPHQASHKCPICNLSYSLYSSWTRHLEKSHPESVVRLTFICEVCAREFSSKRSAANHYTKSHQRLPPPPQPVGDFKCDYCEASEERAAHRHRLVPVLR